MKYLLLIISLMLCNIGYAQFEHTEIAKGESGKYSVSYIHNFYNRTEDVVEKVANKFISNFTKLDRISGPVDDKENKRILATYKLPFDNSGCRKCCVRSLEMNVEISIYYKDNRTKITFTNIKCISEDDECAKGKTLEEYIDCKACKSNNILLRYIKESAYTVSELYKEHLVKASKDNSLF